MSIGTSLSPWPAPAPGAEGHRFGLRGSNDQRQLHRIGQADGSALRMDRGISLDRCVARRWKATKHCKDIDESHICGWWDCVYIYIHILFYFFGWCHKDYTAISPTRRTSVFLEFGRLSLGEQKWMSRDHIVHWAWWSMRETPHHHWRSQVWLVKDLNLVKSDAWVGWFKVVVVVVFCVFDGLETGKFRGSNGDRIERWWNACQRC